MRILDTFADSYASSRGWRGGLPEWVLNDQRKNYPAPTSDARPMFGRVEAMFCVANVPSMATRPRQSRKRFSAGWRKRRPRNRMFTNLLGYLREEHGRNAEALAFVSQRRCRWTLIFECVEARRDSRSIITCRTATAMRWYSISCGSTRWTTQARADFPSLYRRGADFECLRGGGQKATAFESVFALSASKQKNGKSETTKRTRGASMSILSQRFFNDYGCGCVLFSRLSVALR